MISTDTLEELTLQAFRIAEDRGWHDAREIEGVLRKPSAAELVALIHEECTELLRHVRVGLPAEYSIRHDGIPDGAGFELADIIIRCLDYAGIYGIPIADLVAQKIQFNSKRPYRHGGKVL